MTTLHLNDAVASWYAPLQAIESLGSQAAKATRLADLRQAREAHLGQFWTPAPVARAMWRIACQAIDPALARQSGERVSLLDTSIGIGRLMQFADPERHTITGVDVDGDKLRLLGAALKGAGFIHDLVEGELQEVRPRHYGVCLLNPPFSLHLESPLLEPHACTAHGRFGPNTSAMSHVYALHQGLAAADVVIALVPRTTVEEVVASPELQERLHGVLHLSADAFVSEHANVSTSILIFGDRPCDAVRVVRWPDLDAAAPPFDLHCRTTGQIRPRALRKIAMDADQPSITLPVTGTPACASCETDFVYG